MDLNGKHIVLGLSGGIAFRKGEAMEVHPMPTFQIAKSHGTRRVLDLTTLARLIDDRTKNESGVRVYIEQVSAMPKQGVVSMFTFGECYGAIRGIVAAYFLQVHAVTPNVWKRALKVGADKDDARHRASQLMPTYSHLWARRKDDGLAEAAMIALFAQECRVFGDAHEAQP